MFPCTSDILKWHQSMIAQISLWHYKDCLLTFLFSHFFLLSNKRYGYSNAWCWFSWPSLWRKLTAAWTLRRPEELIKRRVTEIHQQAIVYLMMPPASPVVLLANKRPVLWSRDRYWPIRDQYSGHTEPSLHMRCIPDNWSLSASSSH